MDIRFRKLIEPTPVTAAILEKWENDPALVPLTRVNKDRAALEKKRSVTVTDLQGRLSDHEIYLIYAEDQLVGEMDYQVEPPHIYKKDLGSAWVGILIGEEVARGKGIGWHAFQHLENEINARGLKRIELGVFEFNTRAIQLYKRLGYNEIARLEQVTFWQDRMWQDIRMEKYI